MIRTCWRRRCAPKGKRRNLTHDVDHKDDYGRTLAHIEFVKGRLLSTELAMAGLGVLMVVDRNDARIGEPASPIE